MDILVRQAKKHDKDAFSQLMKLHTPSMYKIAKAILKNDEDTADAIHVRNDQSRNAGIQPLGQKLPREMACLHVFKETGE